MTNALPGAGEGLALNPADELWMSLISRFMINLTLAFVVRPVNLVLLKEEQRSCPGKVGEMYPLYRRARRPR